MKNKLLVWCDDPPEDRVISMFVGFRVVYYESMNRELKRRPIYECRCDERLKTKDEGSTRLTYTVELLPNHDRTHSQTSSIPHHFYHVV